MVAGFDFRPRAKFFFFIQSMAVQPEVQSFSDG